MDDVKSQSHRPESHKPQTRRRGKNSGKKATNGQKHKEKGLGEHTVKVRASASSGTPERFIVTWYKYTHPQFCTSCTYPSSVLHTMQLPILSTAHHVPNRELVQTYQNFTALL